MGYDDELSALGVLAQKGQEAIDVEVVERGLDLVEDVERARFGQEDGEQDGERGQRVLTAGEQRGPLHRLAGRCDLDLDPEQVLRGGTLARFTLIAFACVGSVL